MVPIIAFPALAGMTYPILEGRGLMRIEPDFQAILALPQAERDPVRVLMTSASRGCSAELAKALPNLRLVVSQGAGRDLLDLTALASGNLRIRCVSEALTDDVADLAIALTHMLCRKLRNADNFVRNGAWSKGRFELGDSVVGMTMGIGGLSGCIGQAIAARARVSRMQIAGLNRPSNFNLGATLFESWVELAKASDVLVLALPGTENLRHIIGQKELSALGPQGRLINVGRGSLVDTAALIEALETHTIAGAALDVFDTEPEIPERLAALPNVILTPHIGGQTWGQRVRAAQIAEREILDFLDQTDP